MERTAYFEVADRDGYIFSNCKYEDLIVYTDAPSQAIHFGNTMCNNSAFMIRENDVNILRNISIGKSNPNYPLDVLGNTAIDGSIMTTKSIMSRGIQVKKRFAPYFTDTRLPSGVIAGFSNDTDGLIISIDSNLSSNYIRFEASNTTILNVQGTGQVTTYGDILPSQCNIYNVGSASNVFSRGFINTLHSGTITPPTSKLGIMTSNPSCTLDVRGVDALQLPSGTTLQRPSTTQQGQIRYNTTLNTFEGFGGVSWGSLGGVIDINQDTYISVAGNDDIIRFYTSNKEVMTINSSNEVNINGFLHASTYCNLILDKNNESSKSNAPSVAALSNTTNLAISASNRAFASLITSCNLTDIADANVARNALGLGTSTSNVSFRTFGVNTSSPTTTFEVNGGARINSNLEVMGNISVRGSTTTVDSTTVNISDNIIRLNNGANYLSSLQAGLEVNRGPGYNNYLLVFDEPMNYFRIGQQGQLQTVATRDDSPASHTITLFDNNNKKYTACNLFVYSNNRLGVGVAQPNATLHIRGQTSSTNLIVSDGTADLVIAAGMRFGNTSTDWTTIDPNGNTGNSGVAFWNNVAIQNGLIIGADNTYGQSTPPVNGLAVQGSVGIGTSNPSVSLSVDTTDAIGVPSGTTLQRPSNPPRKGFMRYNTTLDTFEGYGTNNAWMPLGANLIIDNFNSQSTSNVPSSRVLSDTYSIATSASNQAYSSRSISNVIRESFSFFQPSNNPTGFNRIQSICRVDGAHWGMPVSVAISGAFNESMTAINGTFSSSFRMTANEWYKVAVAAHANHDASRFAPRLLVRNSNNGIEIALAREAGTQLSTKSNMHALVEVAGAGLNGPLTTVDLSTSPSILVPSSTYTNFGYLSNNFYSNETWTTANSNQIWTGANVGIGTNTVTHKLTIGGETTQYPASLIINETSHVNSKRAGLQVGNWLMLQDINGNGNRNFGIYQGDIGGATPMNVLNILPNGNTGIGTTNPQATLDVNGTIARRGLLCPVGFYAYMNRNYLTFDINTEYTILYQSFFTGAQSHMSTYFSNSTRAFTCPQAGFYNITATLHVYTPPGWTSGNAWLYAKVNNSVNTAQLQEATFSLIQSGYDNTILWTDILYLNQGDTVSMHVFSNQMSYKTLRKSVFYGYLIS